MPFDLAPPGIALAIVVTFVSVACLAAVMRADSSGRVGPLIVMIVLTLAMAGSVVACDPPQAGDMRDEHR